MVNKFLQISRPLSSSLPGRLESGGGERKRAKPDTLAHSKRKKGGKKAGRREY